MVFLKGKQGFTGVNLVVRSLDGAVSKDGNTKYLDVQVDARDHRSRDQTNLHLASQRQEDGSYTHGAAYAVEDDWKMAWASGDDGGPLYGDEPGDPIGKVYCLKADLKFARDGRSLIVDMNTLSRSDFGMDEKLMYHQAQAMARASEAQKAASIRAERVTDMRVAPVELRHERQNGFVQGYVGVYRAQGLGLEERGENGDWRVGQVVQQPDGSFLPADGIGHRLCDATFEQESISGAGTALIRREELWEAMDYVHQPEHGVTLSPQHQELFLPVDHPYRKPFVPPAARTTPEIESDISSLSY